LAASGTRIGSYVIESAIGAGGMGEVYRARDTKLDRDVALKLLPEAFASDPERLARFEREAKTLAALNHPHIAHIHGVEHENTAHALVMELIDGEDLSDRIALGPVPIDEALPIAAQIAEALAAAHAKGIVHRDLKPANIKIASSGHVKVLDFGLAQIVSDQDSGELCGSPTVTANYTKQGEVLGTAAYMSPEQARGQVTDRRTDVWSFGCVLYEMLAGRRAFAKTTVSDTIAAVLEREPDWSALPAATPPIIRLLLGRCLEKDQRRRRRDIADIAIDLEQAAPASFASHHGAPERGARAKHVVQYLSFAVIAATAVAAVWAWSVRRGNTVVAPDVAEFTISPPPGTTFPVEVGAPWPSISPDGHKLAFVALASNGGTQLWLRPIGSAAAQPLAGTEGAARPFWAPDSRAIGFFADGKIKRLDLASGTVQNVCDAPYLGGMSATWGADDVILFTHVGGLFRVSASGGAPLLALPDASTPGDRNQRQNPSFLADGRHFLFVNQRSKQEENQICVGSIDGQESRCILNASSPARYVDPGYLLFVRDGVLRLQRFDADRLVTSGEARPISSSQIRVNPVFRPPPFSIAPNVLAFHPGNAAAQLVWRNRTGATVSTVGELGDYASWSASADERRVATSRTDPRAGNVDIWLKDQNRSAWSRFTFDAAADNNPVFSPDGSRIAFGSTRAGVPGIYVKPTIAAGSEQLLATFGAREAGPQDWSADGRLILYSAYNEKSNWDLGVVAADGRTPGTLVIQSQHGERGGKFSPDVKWIAYDSTESGRREVWIQPFPPTGDRWQVSTTGGISPQWRRDGRELFYIAADGILTAVSVGPGPVPVIGSATPLFQTLLREGAAGFHASSGGQRFLMMVPPPYAEVTPITVRLNWRSTIEQP